MEFFNKHKRKIACGLLMVIFINMGLFDIVGFIIDTAIKSITEPQSTKEERPKMIILNKEYQLLEPGYCYNVYGKVNEDRVALYKIEFLDKDGNVVHEIRESKNKYEVWNHNDWLLEFTRTDVNGNYSIFYDSNNYTISNRRHRLQEGETEPYLVDYSSDGQKLAICQGTSIGLLFSDVFDERKYVKVITETNEITEILDNYSWAIYELKDGYADMRYKDGEEEKFIKAKLDDVSKDHLRWDSLNIMESEEITIDEERYDKLVGLMSYEEATEIIGSKGELKRSNKNEDGITTSAYGYLAEEFEVYVSYNSRGISEISKIKRGIN